MSSANAGSMWPTAKIARAIVGEPPDSSSTLQVDLGRGVEVQPPQRAPPAASPRPAPPSRRRGDVAVHRRLAGLDHDLAEQDDQEQAEALGEVVRVERLGGVGGRQRLQSWSRRSPARRLAVLGEHRAGLHADARSPTARSGTAPGTQIEIDEQRRRDQARARDPLPQQVRAAAVHERARRPARAGSTARLSAKTVLSPGRRRLDRDRRDARPARCRPGTAAAARARRRRGGCRGRRSRPTSTTASRTGPSAIHTLCISGLGHDQVRELPDREHEDEVEVQLDPRDALALLDHAVKTPGQTASWSARVSDRRLPRRRAL